MRRAITTALLIAGALLCTSGVEAGSLRKDAGKKDPLPPAAIRIPPPTYPSVEDRSQAGSVLVQAWISANGFVDDAELLHSELPSPFVDEALRAALECRFAHPTESGGKRGTRIVIPFLFNAPVEAPVDAPPPVVETASPVVVAPQIEERPKVEPEPVEKETIAGKIPLPATDAEPLAEAPETPPASRFHPPLSEASFGQEILNRELERPGEIFRTGERVFFWNRFEGAEAGEEIRHVWLLDGLVVQEIPLKLPESNWRSWSYKTLFRGLTGEWSVEVRRADGTLLGRSDFVCLAASP